MRIDLIGRRSQALFLAAVLLPSVLLTFLGGEAWLAERWDGTSRPELWRKAARLEPGNAEYWRHLGLYEQWGIAEGGNPQAIGYLRRATQTNPRSAGLWMDLADAYAASGNAPEAQRAFERARAEHPISAEVAWRYGSFCLSEGNFAKGYAEIQRALLVEPSLAASAMAECWQANPDIGALLDQMLPAQSRYYLTAMEFFLSRNLLDPALAVWNRELALDLPVALSQAIPLVNALIDQNRLPEAKQTWQQALGASRRPRDASAGSSLVFNGGFERPMVGGGFGWREIPADGVTYARDGNVSHSGSYSLRIDFGGKANLEFQNVFELVPVEPGTRYRFSACVRTQAISTDHGIQFRIFDPQHPSAGEAFTPNMMGTNPWTVVGRDFTTGKDTHLLEIALRRRFSWKFDNKIRGTAWVDDVALAPLPAQAQGGGR